MHDLVHPKQQCFAAFCKNDSFWAVNIKMLLDAYGKLVFGADGQWLTVYIKLQPGPAEMRLSF